MTTKLPMLKEPNYDPNHLLDQVLLKLSLKNDAALSRLLGVAPTILSKVRHRRLPVSAVLIILIHEATEMSIDEIHLLMGVPSFRRQRHAALPYAEENYH